MKTTYSKMARASLFAAIAAWAGLTSHAGEVACKTGCCSQPIGQCAQGSGYLNSPRGREEFPWLARKANLEKARSEKLVAVERNSALGRSPRFIEEHPELLRSARVATIGTVVRAPLEISSNKALAASPRAREEFPVRRIEHKTREEKLVCHCGSL